MDSNGKDLSSTELLVGGAPAWIVSTPLPRQLYGMRGLTLGNTLYLTAGWDGTNYRQEVLAWEEGEQEWVEVGKTQRGRKFHAVTSIMTDSPAMQFCV